MSKPYHLMTPDERTTARIAQNRAISDRIAENKATAPVPAASVRSTRDFTRATPEEHAKVSKLGGVVRKLTS